MPRVQQYDKRAKVTYVYDADYIYNPETKQGRYKRTIVGKIDPETGDIVPCGKPGRPKKKVEEISDNGTDYKTLYDDSVHMISSLEKKLESQKERLATLEQANRTLTKQLGACKKKLDSISAICNSDIK